MRELLIQRGADVNARDPSGQSLLALAVKNGNSAAADLLRQKGARE